MHLDELVAALDAGEDLFALEQRVRRSDPATADLIVVHRSAIRADGARALLQRMGRATGPVWLEPLLPEPIIGQPLWGHDAAIASMWVDQELELLVTRGRLDGRLRQFGADGVCHLDRVATPLDEARRLGEQLVVVIGEGRDAAVELRDPDTGELHESVALPSSDGYVWVETVRVLETGMVGLYMGEEDPLYGARHRWLCFDPRTKTTQPMPTPSEVVRFAGRVAGPQPDGTIRLVDELAQLDRRHDHGWRVGAVALAGDRFVSGSEDGIRIHDRSGELLARGTEHHRGLAQIVIADPIVTTSRYVHQSSSPAPHARLWDPISAKAGRRVDAGERYNELMSCDPTGARVAYTKDGELCLAELDAPRRAPKPVRLTWHYDRRIAWSADGLRLAIQHHGRAPTVWNLDTGVRERILSTDVLSSAHVGISEDGELVTVDHGFYCLRAIRIEDGEAQRSIEPGFNISCSASRGTKGVCGGVEGGFWFDRASNRRIQHKRGAWIRACHVAGPLAALAGSDGVYAIALETGELAWRWVCEEVEQEQVAVVGDRVVSLDARGLMTTLHDGAIELQRMAMPEPGDPADMACSMCALPDGSVLVACPDGWIRRWDPITGDLIDDYELGGRGLDELSYGGGKVVVRRWTDRHGPTRASTWVGFRLDDRKPLSLPAGAERPRLTPDGRRLISLDLVARLDVLDARTAELLEHRPFGSWPFAEQLAFVDGEVRGCDPLPISDGVHEVEARADGTIEVTRAGELVARWVAPRQWTCAAIDGDRVAAGDAAGDLALWAVRREGLD